MIKNVKQIIDMLEWVDNDTNVFIKAKDTGITRFIDHIEFKYDEVLDCKYIVLVGEKVDEHI